MAGRRVSGGSVHGGPAWDWSLCCWSLLRLPDLSGPAALLRSWRGRPIGVVGSSQRPDTTERGQLQRGRRAGRGWRQSTWFDPSPAGAGRPHRLAALRTVRMSVGCSDPRRMPCPAATRMNRLVSRGRETNPRVPSPSARQSIRRLRRSRSAGVGRRHRWPLPTASRPRHRACPIPMRTGGGLRTRVAPAVPQTRHRGPWRCDCVRRHRRDTAANPLELVGDDIGPSVVTMLKPWPRSIWMPPPPTGNRLAGCGDRVGW
jgi:hypothetical protein